MLVKEDGLEVNTEQIKCVLPEVPRKWPKVQMFGNDCNKWKLYVQVN